MMWDIGTTMRGTAYELDGRVSERGMVRGLAPADLRKEGPAYDLPIAAAILVASEQIWPSPSYIP